MLDGKVIPLLFGLELSDLSGPLSQFQAQKVESSGVMEVVRAINKVAEKPASTQIVDQLVPTLWPQLQTTLTKISERPSSEKHKRAQHEILEELVTGVRGLNTRMRDIDLETSDNERRFRRSRLRFHPQFLQEIAMISGDGDDGSLVLVFVAGLLREELPWLAELMTETYREIRNANRDEIELSFFRLRSIIKQMRHHPLFREMSMGSKEHSMLLEALPMMLDLTFQRLLERPSPRKAGKSD